MSTFGKKAWKLEIHEKLNFSNYEYNQLIYANFWKYVKICKGKVTRSAL